MRARPLPLLALLPLLVACVGRGASGRSDMGRPFVPPSDRQLQQVLGDYPTPGPNATQAFKDARGDRLAFPGGSSSFADALVSFRAGDPSPIPEGLDPRAALGSPDYESDIWQPPRAVSLGNGGALTLRFDDNV